MRSATGWLLAVGWLLTAAVGCDRLRGERRATADWDPAPPKPALPEAKPTRKARETPHPRILFTPEAQKRLRAAVAARTPMWRKLKSRCDVYANEGDKSSGYLGLQWGEAIGTLSTCYHATGDKRYGEKAMRYLRALLEDRNKVGDGEGGDKVVRANSGYPIRAYGVYVALAFDWLHDFPGMAELRPKIIERLDAWLGWYHEDGYLNDSPYSNYFWGYFTALAIAGLATDGEAEEAAVWQERTQSLLEGKIVPGFFARLRGGEWAEGWRYGQLVTMEAALVVDAFRTATGADYSKRLPWLAEIVDAYLHRMRPDRQSVYGNGTQDKQPPPPDPSGLACALLVLDWSNPDAAARARFLINRFSPEVGGDRVWFAFVADVPGAEEKDPRSPEVLSYHLAGPGQTFLRSSWQENAIWVSFQAGSRVAIDHQHNDQGHFELWRGSDPLLSEFSEEGAYATMNHNSILIEAGEDVVRYTPSHGVYGRNSRTVRWHDSGAAAVMVGDLTDNWDPKCVIYDCKQRAVTKVQRTLIYVRPNVIVTDDQIVLTDDGYGVTWAAHVRAAPQVAGTRASAVWGESRVDVHALAPQGALVRGVKEPTAKDDHIYRANLPDGDVWRVEIETARGEEARHIRTWIRAANAGAAPDSVVAVRGNRLSGAAGVAEAARIAVLFADGADGGDAVVEGRITRALITGLTPGEAYRAAATAASGCRVEVKRESGGTVRADPSGTILLDTAACTGH